MALYALPLARATSRMLKSRSGQLKSSKIPYMRYKERGKGNVKAERLKRSTLRLNHASGKDKDTSSGERAPPPVGDVQATAIPDPIPAGIVSTNTIIRTTLTIPPTFSLSTPANAVSTSSEYSPNARSTTTVWIPAPKSTSSQSDITASSMSADASSSSASGHLPVYGIALLAAGGVGLALAALLVLGCFLRRHGRVDRPRPSAPILQESPLFGGNERFSRGIWSDPSFNNLLASHAKIEKGDGWRPLSGGKEPNSEKMQNRRQSVFVDTYLAPNNPVPAPLSPASVYTTAIPPTAVGVALEFPIPPQKVNSATQPLKIKDKGIEGKTVRRRSVTTSLYGGTDSGSPTLTDTETAIAYREPRPAPTPRKPKVALKPSGSSRDNNQRPSRKNVPSHTSQGSLYRSPSASRAARDRGKEEPFLYALPSVKSQERRDRDTKALTSALGLGSPPPPSSCFSPVSIYPDDSLSVAHRRDYMRPHSEVPPSEMPSPAGTHAALGDLMLQEFPSTATFNSMRSGDPFADEPMGKKGGKGRVTDRPPRVPSPPPLPSLSQMALENADPEYRSPTYSIYGLYEAQRKSKRSSMHIS